MAIPHIITRNELHPERDRISINLDGRHRSFLLSSEQGARLHDAVKAEAGVEELRLIADVDAWNVAKQFDANGRTLVLDDRDQLRLNGKVVDFGLTDLIKRMAEAGEDINPLVNFMERAAKNPNKDVARDLYRFLEKGGLPISPDGCFHAYKRVDRDLWSIHSGGEPTWTTVDGQVTENTGKTFYPIGGTVHMRREDCDEDRNRTCSRGLHACSFEYLQSFNGSRIINVVIDPENVTAIPNDYNDSKLRCCKLSVVAEIPEEDARDYFQHVVDRRHPAVDQSTTAPEPTSNDAPAADDWEAEGREAGRDDGKSDNENGYDYHPSIDFPYEIDNADDAATARQSYSRGYLEGYAEGWNSVSDTDEDADEDDDAWTDERARAAGAEDGANAAQEDKEDGSGYTNVPENGEQWMDVPSEHETTYKITYNAAYAEVWNKA